MFHEGHHEQYEQGRALLKQLSADYHGDPELRTRIDGGDSQPVLDALGVDNPGGAELRVVADTPEVYHLPMPLDPNKAMADTALARVVGGSTTGSGGSISSAGSFGCSTAPSTLSSVSTTSTAGSSG